MSKSKATSRNAVTARNLPFHPLHFRSFGAPAARRLQDGCRLRPERCGESELPRSVAGKLRKFAAKGEVACADPLGDLVETAPDSLATTLPRSLSTACCSNCVKRIDWNRPGIWGKIAQREAPSQSSPGRTSRSALSCRLQYGTGSPAKRFPPPGPLGGQTSPRYGYVKAGAWAPALRAFSAWPKKAGSPAPFPGAGTIPGNVAQRFFQIPDAISTPIPFGFNFPPTMPALTGKVYAFRREVDGHGT